MKTRANAIRVGLIGGNPRALWYGAIGDDVDPRAFARMDPGAYHHMTYYDRVDVQVRKAAGFRLAKIYDDDREAARATAEAFRARPRVCADADEVCDGVDLVFIANDSGNGSAHPRLAAPALTRGLPVFIDRPFAASARDAKALLRLARRHGAPLLSCSHLRMLPQAAWFKARFVEIGPLEQAMVQGHGPNPALIADGIELALFLFGDEFGGRATTVQSMGQWPLEIAHLRFEKGKRVLQSVVVNSHTSLAHRAFWAQAASLRNPVDSPEFDAYIQSLGGLAVMNALRDMVRTRAMPLSSPAMIEPVAVTEAGRRSHNGRKAFLVARLR